MTILLPANGDEREDRAAFIAAAVTAIFAGAEAALIASIAAAARKAVTGRGTSTAAIGQRLARQAAAILAVTGQRAARTVTSAGLDPVPETVTASLDSASETAFGSVTSIYQQVTDAAMEAAGGLQSSPLSFAGIRAAQETLNDLLGTGLTGFTDSAARNWDLASYVEMATRAGVSNAYDELLTRSLEAADLDLVLVTHGSEPICGKCAPYLGQLLSLTGATTGTVSVGDAAGGSFTAFVAATLAEAKARGFRHPNCRCSLIPYYNGADLSEAASVPPSPEVLAAQYAAEQRQRALERRVRVANRRQQAAITPQARASARRQVAVALAAASAHRASRGVRAEPRREHPYRAA